MGSQTGKLLGLYTVRRLAVKMESTRNVLQDSRFSLVIGDAKEKFCKMRIEMQSVTLNYAHIIGRPILNFLKYMKGVHHNVVLFLGTFKHSYSAYLKGICVLPY